MLLNIRCNLAPVWWIFGWLALAACTPVEPPPPRTDVSAALGVQPPTGRGDLDRGNQALDSGNIAQARDAFTAAMRTSPNDPRAALGLAETYLAFGQTDTAARLLDATARSSGGSHSARFSQGLGAVALQQGRTEQALRYFRAAVDRTPGLWRSWIGLGRAQILTGDRVSARVSFAQAERAARDHPFAINDIGMSFLAENLATEAVPYFERALALDPSFQIARANLRIARAMSGAYDVAISGATPNELTDALNNAGYVAVLRGDYSVAEKYLRRALELSPEFHAAASANLDLLEQAAAGGQRSRRPELAQAQPARAAKPRQSVPPEPQPEPQPQPQSQQQAPLKITKTTPNLSLDLASALPPPPSRALDASPVQQRAAPESLGPTEFRWAD